jgi:hypothetical protein
LQFIAHHYVGFEVLTAVVMKSSVFWDITPCSPLKVNRHFGGTYRLHLQNIRISKQEASVKQVANRREMQTRKSVPFGSPVRQNEPPVPIGYPTQPREAIGDKTRITSVALGRAGLCWCSKK